MVDVINWLKGKKTFFVIGLAAVVWAAAGMGFVTPELADQLYGGLALAGGATVTAKVQRLMSGS